MEESFRTLVVMGRDANRLTITSPLVLDIDFTAIFRVKLGQHGQIELGIHLGSRHHTVPAPKRHSEGHARGLADVDVGTASEEHLARRTVAAQQSHVVDAKNILRMAAQARSRVISEVQVCQLVYYNRRGKKNKAIKSWRKSGQNRMWSNRGTRSNRRRRAQQLVPLSSTMTYTQKL